MSLLWFIFGFVLGVIGSFWWSSTCLSQEEKDAIDDLYERMKK